MRAEVLIVAGIPLWIGKKQWVIKRAVELAKLRLRFPTVRDLFTHYKLVGGGSEEWKEIVWVRMEGNRPVTKMIFQVSQTGSIRRE